MTDTPLRNLKLGKLPFAAKPTDLHLANYLAGPAAVAPVVRRAPRGFGHAKLVQVPWGMLLNDRLGDCEIARQLHSVMLWAATASRRVRFLDAEAARVYGAVAGYDPAQEQPDGSNPTDQGTVMRDCLNYARTNGVVDSDGNTHRIGAYLFVDPRDTPTMLRAMWLCDQVALGFMVTAQTMSQFYRGLPWTMAGQAGSPSEGGHAVELVGRPTAEAWDLVTWGQLHRATFPFVQAFGDEAWAVISEDQLNGAGRTLEGFDLAALQADLPAL